MGSACSVSFRVQMTVGQVKQEESLGLPKPPALSHPRGHHPGLSHMPLQLSSPAPYQQQSRPDPEAEQGRHRAPGGLCT